MVVGIMKNPEDFIMEIYLFLRVVLIIRLTIIVNCPLKIRKVKLIQANILYKHPITKYMRKICRNINIE